MSKKEPVRLCTICGRKLCMYNPNNHCHHHDLPSNFDPIGDNIRRANNFTSGKCGDHATRTFFEENGGYIQ